MDLERATDAARDGNPSARLLHPSRADAHAALQALRASACVPSDCASDSSGNCHVLHMAIQPPPAVEEFAHESALEYAFADEMRVVRQLQRKLREGEALVRDVYCARSCARAIPPVAHDADATQMRAYYEALFTILRPQVERIKALSEFCAQTVVMLSDNIQRITVHENTTRVIPDVLMDTLLSVVDVVLQLNQLHDTKSSLRNDFSVFKRAFTHVRERAPDAEQVERDIQRLQDFIGNSSQSKGSIWDSLRHNLTNVKRFDQVVYLLLKHCVAHIERDVCLVPHDKFKFVRVLPSLLAVLEDARQNAKSSSNRAAEKKAMEAAARVLQRYPVVPMLAEVNAMPVAAFQSCSSATKSDASVVSESLKHLDPSFDLLATAQRMRSVCRDLLPRLVHGVNAAANGHAKIEQNTALYELVLEALVAVSAWKSSLLLFLALKYKFPKSNDALQQLHASVDSPFVEYERMTKYNFTASELSAMADTVYCVKAVVHVLRTSKSGLLACVRRHVYQHTQTFVQHTLLPLLHRAHKRKLVCTKLLHDARMTCGDWSDPKATGDDYLKRRKDRRFPPLSDRTAAPNLCQLQMLASLINAVYAKRSMGDLNAKQSTASSLFSFKKVLDSSDIDQLQAFYSEVSVFTRALDLQETLRDVSDFSCLWLRELYLEIAKVPQFPTDASLPWMLMEHCLQRSPSAGLGLKPVLAIIDIYNDAGNCALYQLKRQVLVDEAEAEGKLCFDQLVYMLADQLYAQCKSNASRHIDQHARGRKELSSTSAKPKRCEALRSTTASDAYEWIAHAKRVELFGASYNLTFLLGQHVHWKITRDLEKWLVKLESSDATSVLEASSSLEALKTAHTSLSRLIPLDAFDDMLQEVDAQASLPDADGDATPAIGAPSRLQTYVSQIVLLDLCQHFSYDVRSRCFQRVPLPSELEACVPKHFGDADASKPLQYLTRVASSVTLRSQQKALKTHVVIESTPFGARQVHVFLNLLAPDQILDIVDDCNAFIEAKIEDVLRLCISALGTAIPPFRLPRFMYRTEGCFGFFEGKFKHVFECEELEAHVFHCLREIGNGLGFLLLLSDAMDERAILRSLSSEIDDTRARHEQRSGVFRRSLQRFHQMLHATGIAREWHAEPSSHPEAIASSSSFFHVWHALEFLSCNARNGVAGCEQFGDGVQLAGCTIIHLLGQRSLYELWNVSQHVLNVHQHEQTRAPVPASKDASSKTKQRGALEALYSTGIAQSVGTLGHEMQSRAAAFAAHAMHVRSSSARIFHVLETAWPAPSSDSPPSTAGAPTSERRATTTLFRPPAFVPPAPEREPTMEPTATRTLAHSTSSAGAAT